MCVFMACTLAVPCCFLINFSNPLAVAEDERGMAVWVQPVSSWQEPLGHPLVLGSLSRLL